MSVNMKLVAKGDGAPLVGLRENYKVSVALARKPEHAGRLASAGWTPEKTDRLEAAGKELDTTKSAQLEARSSSQRKTSDEVEWRQAAKQFKRRLVNALPSVFELLADDAPVRASDFDVGGELGNSSARISAYLAKIRGPVEKLDTALAPYFDGKSALARLDEVGSGLDGTNTDQETSRAALPADTLAFYELKGRVLAGIEELNRLAKNAFDGEAHLIGLFNKDHLLRATKSRAKPDDVLEPTG